MPRSRPSLVLALAAVLSACAGAPTPASAHAHNETATVIVTDRGLLPDPVVAIPTFATVVWQNRADAALTIEVSAAACNACDTVVGFTQIDTGARSAAIAPYGVTTLCFHDAGTFAYVARVGDVEHHGVIQVGGGR